MIDANISPLATVVIPVRNEVRFIDRCMHSVFSADPVPGDLEVLVVDGMSDDGTRRVLADWGRRQTNLRVLDNPEGIVPTAMNIGVRAARGKWIIRLDAHSEYPHDYFRRCLETGRRTGADNVGGGIVTMSSTDDIEGKLVQALTTHPFGVGNSGFRVGACEGWADTVVFGCYRREVFERIGFYDERLVRNQDYEFNRRLLKSGGRVWYNPAIQARYYNQSSLIGLLVQAFGTGQWNPWMWFVAPYSLAWRHSIPLAFVAALFVALLSNFFAPFGGMAALKLVLVPYFVLAFVASFQQSLRYGTWMFPCLPLLFWTYHVAYGLGGLWGVCLLVMKRAPVQMVSEPWAGAGSYRAWPRNGKNLISRATV